VGSGAHADADSGRLQDLVRFATSLCCKVACSFGTVTAGGAVPRRLTMRMRQSISQFEVAFEQETTLERRRREQLRRRAANRSRERRMSRDEQHSKVRFSVLAVCLTVTVIVVIVVMFEALSFVMA
jgi:hypothetical protein